MPVYHITATAQPGETEKYEVWLDGDFLELARVSFPEGSHGLLRVWLCYGEKQILPWDEGQYFAGNADIYQIQPAWRFPEQPCRLIIYAQNTGQQYPHGCFITLESKYDIETVAGQMVNSFRKWLNSLAGILEV